MTVWNRIQPILDDVPGKNQVGSLLSGLAQTDFEAARVSQILSVRQPVDDWRVGEAFAEAFLIDHRGCEFPWPMGRDVRNPKASPAGADLVGFATVKDRIRFAFGEVKTSSEARWPPNVMSRRHGLQRQIERLRDSTAAKDHLVCYLAHRATDASWDATFRKAAAAYLAEPGDVSLFGLLIRDVTPKKEDLAGRTAALSKRCPAKTSIELRACYLPTGWSESPLGRPVVKLTGRRRAKP